MTDDAPKPKRGRPRVHATPEDARAAAIARAAEHKRVRRATIVERTIALTPAALVRAETLVERRGLDGLTALFVALVDEEAKRTKSVDRGQAAP